MSVAAAKDQIRCSWLGQHFFWQVGRGAVPRLRKASNWALGWFPLRNGGGWGGGLPRGELTHGEGGALLEERAGGLIGEGGLFGEGGGLLGLAEAGEGRMPYGQSDPPPHLGGGAPSLAGDAQGALNQTPLHSCPHDLTPPSAIAAPPQPAEGVARLDGGSPHAEPTREPPLPFAPLPFAPPLSPPRQPCVAEAPPMPRGVQPQLAPHSRVTTHSTGAIVTTPMTPPYPSHRVNHPPHQFMSLPLAIATQIAADSPKFYHYPRVGRLTRTPP